MTYNLHIMLRVEIEMGLLDGTLAVKDLPAEPYLPYLADKFGDLYPG